MPSNGGRSAAQAREHLLEVLGPVVAATGHDLEDVTVAAAGRRSLVRVIVDADGGVDLDAVAEVSRAVSEALDSSDADGFSGPYVLEVSSPGVDRPLTEQRHWRRAVGRLVEAPVGETVVRGRVLEASERGVRIDVQGTPREIAWQELGHGMVQIEFNRAEH
jgi:ribosome maturation factor RimP